MTTAVESQNDNDLTLHARCCCKQVEVEATGAPVYSVYCHCGTCQNWSGAAFCHSITFSPDKFKVTQGEDNLMAYKTSPHITRYTCKTCSSPVVNDCQLPNLHFKGLESGTIILEHRSKLKDTPYKPAAHLFYPNRLVDVQDDLPKLDGLPESDISAN
ncbi:hypothetical protein ABBQ38_004987 [Trebouxia sp. C0009 RCD-2024]